MNMFANAFSLPPPLQAITDIRAKCKFFSLCIQSIFPPHFVRPSLLKIRVTIDHYASFSVSRHAGSWRCNEQYNMYFLERLIWGLIVLTGIAGKLCFYIYLLHDIIRVWLEYMVYIYEYVHRLMFIGFLGISCVLMIQ